MLELLIVVLGTVAVASGLYTLHERRKVTATGVEPSEYKGLWPIGRVLLKEYNALPADSRAEDILPVVRALQVKYHGKQDRVELHFSSPYGYDYRFSWKCHCTRYGSGCREYPEFYNLHKEIAAIVEAIEHRAQALREAEVQHDLDYIKTFTQRLRDEKDIITQTTKDLT